MNKYLIIKKTLICCLFLILATSSFSQTLTITDLSSLYNKLKQTDVERLDVIQSFLKGRDYGWSSEPQFDKLKNGDVTASYSYYIGGNGQMSGSFIATVEVARSVVRSIRFINHYQSNFESYETELVLKNAKFVSHDIGKGIIMTKYLLNNIVYTLVRFPENGDGFKLYGKSVDTYAIELSTAN